MCTACYLHVPFCKDICAYCDFTRCRYHHGLAEQWLSSIQKEVQEHIHTKVSSMYIGGGTPSALTDNQLQTLLEVLKPYYEDDCEVTIEANIDSFTVEKIRLCKEMGVNRVSLGVQTLQKELLEKINRLHSEQEVLQKIKEIQEEGIVNISIDLLYGLPGQTLAMWERDLERVVKFPISHISLYALTIEEHSQFGRDGVQNIDSEVEGEMYDRAIAYLEQQGFHQYEISNFAKLGNESRHNTVYWHYEDFYGIGCGASGKEQHQRYDNTKNLHTYIQCGPSPTYSTLTKEDEIFEYIMMGLRLKKGISLSRFERIFSCKLQEKYSQVVKEQCEQGLLLLEGDTLKTTDKGFHFLNDVLLSFMED